MSLKPWIEAMRLRTLPVSLAGVATGIAYAILYNKFLVAPAMLCVAFAILAQIASNFANEYYDFKAGLDRKGRQGPRRGVTEGDITPKAMKIATYFTLALACLAGLGLVLWGGWWLIAVGAGLAVGALSYSAGPYPLSRHGLGEVAVIFFFGLVPVNFTYYVQVGSFDLQCLLGSISIGLMGANVLIVNNYRDCYDDASVGKITLAGILGERATTSLYLFNGFIAVALMMELWLQMPRIWLLVPFIYLMVHTTIWYALRRLSGSSLNPLLGATALAMLTYAVFFLVCCKINH